MVTIKTATEKDAEIIALLGRTTYAESHGQFIENKDDLIKYNEEAFSIPLLRQQLNDSKNRFYLICVNELPVGYAKLILDKTHESVQDQNACSLDKLYILSDFIPLKIGQQFLSFIEEQAQELRQETIWLITYFKNHRAIKFYERNGYRNIGKANFMVNGVAYENIVYSKKFV